MIVSLGSLSILGTVCVLGQVKAIFAFSQCKSQPLSHHFDRGVVREFQIVDASHDGRKKVVWVLGLLHCLAYNGERGVKCFET